MDVPTVAEEILSLWLEYESADTPDCTPEAQVAKNLDKFEMIVQADEYERANGVILEDFFSGTHDSFTHYEIRSWAEELRRNRNTRLGL